MVLQSTFPLAHVAFGNNWKSPDTFTESLCLSPCLRAVLTGRCCMSAPHPILYCLQHQCSWGDQACHEE